MKRIDKFLRAVAVAALSVATVIASPAVAQIYKGETAGVGDPVHTMFVAFANTASKGGVDIQVNAGQTLTKSMLNAAKGKLDFYSGVPSLVTLMAGGKAMYEPIADAPELSRNLRAIMGFEAGAYHPITLEGSDIEDWPDIKGKTVFTGPPSGSAAATSEGLIRAITGYEPNVDYTAVRLSWGEGYTALGDGKIDMMIRPAEIGSANIEQFGLSGKFRLLSIPEDLLEKPELQSLMGQAGRGATLFPGDTYKGQVTQGDIRALGYYQFIGTQKAVADDAVYAATKAFWENIAEVQATAFFLQKVTPETAFTAINVPLHPGALRYYEEAGYEIPNALRAAE